MVYYFGQRITRIRNAVCIFEKMLSHFAPHYGSNEIRNWRFELEYNTLFDEKKRNYIGLYTIRSKKFLRYIR